MLTQSKCIQPLSHDTSKAKGSATDLQPKPPQLSLSLHSATSGSEGQILSSSVNPPNLLTDTKVMSEFRSVSELFSQKHYMSYIPQYRS